MLFSFFFTKSCVMTSEFCSRHFENSSSVRSRLEMNCMPSGCSMSRCFTTSTFLVCHRPSSYGSLFSSTRAICTARYLRAVPSVPTCIFTKKPSTRRSKYGSHMYFSSWSRFSSRRFMSSNVNSDLRASLGVSSASSCASVSRYSSASPSSSALTESSLRSSSSSSSSSSTKPLLSSLLARFCRRSSRADAFRLFWASAVDVDVPRALRVLFPRPLSSTCCSRRSRCCSCRRSSSSLRFS
mmetsp:Transcript_50288/g.126228  ORF Transcript_50288/g.126228 Transcript_50288/m.126228 type:complete len:240 (-) Transcript_50288:223-942(-)